MTSNLVSMDISPLSQEVNNNNQDKSVVTQTEESTTKEDCSSLYSLNDTFRIKVTSPEEWLCVARMPRDFSQTEFESLLDDFGPIQQCFLIHSDISGTSKGYGLVKYVSKASSIQARHVLEGLEVRDGHVLDCDWLGHNRPNVTSLHSKCLYVDQLPPDYRDMAQFRRLFSKVVNPPYCQIAMKNGVIHNWGLVEYQTSQDAEATMQALSGATIEGHPFRVQFCIPGVHAINIYMAFVNNPMDAVQEKKALLEEAPSSKVYDQLNSLAKHNPWFVANLQNIMATNKKPFIPPTSTANADPAQAALILLLAGKVAQGPPETTATLVQGIIKQMSSGLDATEILRGIIKPQQNEDLIQTAIKMASCTPEQPSAKSDKCPLLMELLYKSFQARLAKEQRLKVLKQTKTTEPKPNHATISAMLVPTTPQLSTTEVPSFFQHAELIQTPAAAYPLFSYYMNPMQYQYQTLLQSQCYMPTMNLTSQQMASPGIKRVAAGPVIYPGNQVEKRMKLA